MLNRINYKIIVIKEMVKEYVVKTCMKNKYGSSDRHLINENTMSFFWNL